MRLDAAERTLACVSVRECRLTVASNDLLAATPASCHARSGVAAVGGILGVIAGFVVGVVIEVAFWNDAGGWADTLPFALAAAGGLVGAAVGRRLAANPGASGRLILSPFSLAVSKSASGASCSRRPCTSSR